jgi:hypothetical protein
MKIIPAYWLAGFCGYRHTLPGDRRSDSKLSGNQSRPVQSGGQPES